MTISKKRLDEIAAIKDEDIDYSDVPELDDRFWANAELRMPNTKDRVTIRIDRDILQWFKSKGRGYQTRINAILRAFYETHRDSPR
jgi:uncharacterized protein (DUF4415 family)